MPSCKKRVYKRMCEKPDGTRSGSTKKVRYQSRPKKKGGKKR